MFVFVPSQYLDLRRHMSSLLLRSISVSSRRLPDLIMSNTEKRKLLSLREQLDSPSVFLVRSLLTLGNYWVHPPGFWWVNVVYLLSFLCFVLFCLSSSCLVLGVVCVSGLFILDCPFGFL